MANETAIVSRIQGPDDLVDSSPSKGPLSDSEARAAGWLAEALSAPDSVAASNPLAQAESSHKLANVGDAILRGLTKVSDNYMKTAGELHSAIENDGAGSPGVMGALKMHMAFIEVSLQADTASKCISKSEQTIEQLVKQQ
jgi:hypothetical protein